MTGHDVRSYLGLLRWIGLGIAGVNLGFIYVIQRARLRRADLWSFQVVFLTLPFVLKTSWPHDFGFLPFTQALVAWGLWGTRGEAAAAEKAGKSHLVRAAVAVFLLFPSIVLSNVVFFNAFGDFARYGALGFLFWANLLLLIALYLELLQPALGAPRRPRSYDAEI